MAQLMEAFGLGASESDGDGGDADRRACDSMDLEMMLSQVLHYPSLL
jgi:hypothetical protein